MWFPRKENPASQEVSAATGEHTTPSDRSVVRGLAVVAIVSVTGALGCLVYAGQQPKPAATSTMALVIGDMGGVPMEMPRYFAEWAEYEGEPTWEPRKGPIPVRTFESKFVSFAYKVRYPDMAELTTPELRNEYTRASLGTTQWIRVLVSTGSHFGTGHMVDQILERKLTIQFVKYKRDIEPQFGLTTYRPSWIDPSLDKVGRLHFDEDLFVHHDEAGSIDTLIVCSNVKHNTAPCTQWLRLAPAINAWLTIDYRRGLLDQWKGIEDQARSSLLKYRVRGDTKTGS